MCNDGVHCFQNGTWLHRMELDSGGSESVLTFDFGWPQRSFCVAYECGAVPARAGKNQWFFKKMCFLVFVVFNGFLIWYALWLSLSSPATPKWRIDNLCKEVKFDKNNL